MNTTENIARYLDGRVVLDGENGDEFITAEGRHRTISKELANLLSDKDLTMETLLINLISMVASRDSLQKSRMELISNARDEKNRVASDCHTLGEYLWEKCEELGMTSQQYDEWIKEINDDTNVIVLTKRKRSWEVTLTYHIEVETQITVEAYDEDEAGDLAKEEWTEDEVLDQIRDEFQSGDIEVERAEEE